MADADVRVLCCAAAARGDAGVTGRTRRCGGDGTRSVPDFLRFTGLFHNQGIPPYSQLRAFKKTHGT
eukprot:1020709-Prymnesium_polylepis.1